MVLQLVSFELAKKLKEIGFDIHLDTYYPSRLDTIVYAPLRRDWNRDFTGRIPDLCTAPTQALAQMWFREKYNLHLPISGGKGYIHWYYTLYERDICIDDNDFGYKTYEKALEVGLLKACEIIKEKQSNI